VTEKKKLGRKFLPENKRRSCMMHVRVTEVEERQLKQRAEKNNMKLADYIRSKLFNE